MGAISISGIAKLQAQIAAYRAQVHAGFAKELAEAAQQIATDAQNNAPVDSGELRASIHVANANGTGVEVVADVDYAVFVELGTGRQAARPFLSPAYHGNKQRLLERLRAVLKTRP